MTIEQLRAEVEEKINAIDYKWQDTETNVRLMNEIRENVDSIPNIPSAKHIAEVAVACGEYLQLRDFVLGLYVEKPKDKVIAYLALLLDILDKENSVALLTILSSYMYEMNKPGTAREYLDTVLEIDPDYALANLLDRVYAAEWDPRMLTDMIQRLHPTVVKTIETGLAII